MIDTQFDFDRLGALAYTVPVVSQSLLLFHEWLKEREREREDGWCGARARVS